MVICWGDYESDGIFFEIRDTETGNFIYGEKIEYSAEPEVLDADGNSLGGTYRNPYGEMCLYNGSYTIKLVAKLISTGWDADYWGQAGAITGYNEFGQPEGGASSWDDSMMMKIHSQDRVVYLFLKK